MSDIILYTKDYCPYCKQAKALLRRKGVEFTEYDIQTDPALVDEMIARSNGGRTVPQIFIGDTHVGGAMDMFELDKKGGLDPLLAPYLKRLAHTPTAA